MTPRPLRSNHQPALPDHGTPSPPGAHAMTSLTPYEPEPSPEPAFEATFAHLTIALTQLLASEVNQGHARRFVCGYCRREHVLEQRKLPGNYRVYVIRDRPRDACGLASESATPWEAAARVTAAVTLGGHLYEAQRDGSLY